MAEEGQEERRGQRCRGHLRICEECGLSASNGGNGGMVESRKENGSEWVSGSFL